MVFAPDGQSLAIGEDYGKYRPQQQQAQLQARVLQEDDDALRLWDTTSGRELRRFAMPGLGNFAFSPDGRSLALGCYGFAVILDVASGRELYSRIAFDTDGLPSIAFSPDGLHLAVGSGTLVCLREAATGRELRRFFRYRPGDGNLAFSPDGRILAYEASWRTVRLLDVMTGDERPLGDCPPWESTPIESPASESIVSQATSSKATVRFWNPLTWGKRPPAKMERHVETKAEPTVERKVGPTDYIQHIAFSADGRILACGSSDGMVRLWDIPAGAILGRVHEEFFALAPDGRTLATVSGFSPKLWEVETGRQLAPLQQRRYPRFVGFVPGGNCFAIGAMEGADLVEVPTGNVLRSFTDAEKERQIEADARSEKVLPRVEQAVDKLLAIQNGGFFIVPNLKKGIFECPCSIGNLSANYRAVVTNGIISCEHCGRTSTIHEFDEKFRNKSVVQIGSDLYANGGMDAMRSAGYRFQARGGYVPHLSIAWDGVGGWMD